MNCSSRPRLARRIATALAVPAVALTSLLAVGTTPAQAACSDVDVVFARGTGETPGLGILGRPLVSGLQSQLGGYTVSSYAVDYAANSSQTSAGPGATDMSAHVSSVAASCPGTRFVIGGYSQGATVTDIAISIRTGVTMGTPIPSALSGRVAAVVVFGNPLGASGRTIATSSTVYGPKSRDYCNVSDSICGRQGSNPAGEGSGGHLSYSSNGSVTQAATFAAGLVRAGGTGGGTTPTPTPTTCVTASTLSHVAADRAVSLYGRAYARGSRDALGLTSSYNTVSLRQSGTASWDLVASC
ncbi:cutinase [Microlunatus sagamiharensis]|uniref:Cutinase n=1 Tax=Microlunatus sagamiharensis TaxID=546874 RepID=A0A1H2M542_9ACTN|nr:cutinase family protein [Microlunatus sagamiharensis]SDU88380.1 cutinase [Microlunatus sagamiharensis]